MKRRQCSELGVCQGRSPACLGCHQFAPAPGVIEGPFHRPRRFTIKRIVIVVALIWLVAFFAGLLGTAWRLL